MADSSKADVLFLFRSGLKTRQCHLSSRTSFADRWSDRHNICLQIMPICDSVENLGDAYPDVDPQGNAFLLVTAAK